MARSPHAAKFAMRRNSLECWIRAQLAARPPAAIGGEFI
jgi:hypothetical protein